MGLLKKLQDENKDDGTQDGLGADGDFSGAPEPGAVTPSPAPDPAAAGEKAAENAEKKDADKKAEEQAAPQDPEVVPAEVVKLELMLRGHDWWFDFSDDASVRRSGGQSLDKIYDQLRVCEAAGFIEDARKMWQRYAPKEHAIPNIFAGKQADASADKASGPAPGPGFLVRRPGEPFSEPYNRRIFNRPAGAAGAVAAQATPPGQAPQQQPDPAVQYAGGGVQTDLLSKALSAPFAITAAAGSLIVSGLRYAGDKVRGFYVKGRENGHAILGQQLDEAASNIVTMTDSLKHQGMGDLIAEMKATGRPAREIFKGMTPGGAYQNFSDRFTALMKNESFAQQYAKLEDALSDFGFKATHYAQTGIELNRDYAEAVERNVEKISAATEGFVFKKDGVIKHLQELVRSISDTISTMINNLLGRHKPQ